MTLSVSQNNRLTAFCVLVFLKGRQSFLQSRLLSTVPEDGASCHDNGARTWYLRHGRTVGDRCAAGAGRLRHPANASANSDEDQEVVFVANNGSSSSPLLDRRSHSMTMHFRSSADDTFKQQTTTTTTAFVRWHHQHPRSLLQNKTESMELAPPGECLDKQTQLLLQSGRSSMV